MNTAQKGPLLGQGRTAEVFAWGEGQIIKLYRDDYPPEYAQREVQIAEKLMETGLSVPGIGGNIEVDGRQGVIYERINGPTLLMMFAAQPWKLRRWAHILADLQASMHEVSVDQLPSQRDDLLDRIGRAPRLTQRKKELILAHLEQLPDDDKLCHGDYHVDNVLLSPRGPVIIDWLTARRGQPLADAARTYMTMSIDPIPPGTKGKAVIEILRKRFARLYLKRYASKRGITAQEVLVWLLPCAAARLCDNVSEAERTKILALIDAELAGLPH